MPELDFKITAIEPVTHGLTPSLNFQLAITNRPATENIHSIILRVQIQISAPERDYNEREKEKLAELFGRPVQWSQTLRNRFWTNVNVAVGPFADTTSTRLSVPCTYDLNVAAAKYFYALEEGEAPLLFLFSGTVFYAGPDGQLQIQQISWNLECSYRMPAQVWRGLMEEHYPNSAWLYLNRDVFDRLYAYKRRHGLATWEQTIEGLLPVTERKEMLA